MKIDLQSRTLFRCNTICHAPAYFVLSWGLYWRSSHKGNLLYACFVEVQHQSLHVRRKRTSHYFVPATMNLVLPIETYECTRWLCTAKTTAKTKHWQYDVENGTGLASPTPRCKLSCIFHIILSMFYLYFIGQDQIHSCRNIAVTGSFSSNMKALLYFYKRQLF